MEVKLEEHFNKTFVTENNTAGSQNTASPAWEDYRGTENNTSAARNTAFPVWEDYRGSIDDLQYFLIGLYTFVSLLGFMGNLLILMAVMKKRNQKTTVNILKPGPKCLVFMFHLSLCPFSRTLVVLVDVFSL